MNDKEWIKELKNGNPAAFKKLVGHHRKKVLNTCYRFLNSREDAEEIAQEVFIEVYKSISRFREEAALSTWIYRIAVTKSLDYLRKLKRKKRFDYGKKINGFEKEVEHIPAPPGTNPEVELEEQERFGILREAMESLAENQRIALTLSKYDGFSHKEIADIMGITVSAIEALIHRAKKNLKKKLFRYFKTQGSLKNDV